MSEKKIEVLSQYKLNNDGKELLKDKNIKKNLMNEIVSATFDVGVEKLKHLHSDDMMEIVFNSAMNHLSTATFNVMRTMEISFDELLEMIIERMKHNYKLLVDEKEFDITLN